MDHRLLLTLLLGLLLVKGEEEASVETVPDDVETVGGVWGRVRDPESPIVHLQVTIAQPSFLQLILFLRGLEVYEVDRPMLEVVLPISSSLVFPMLLLQSWHFASSPRPQPWPGREFERPRLLPPSVLRTPLGASWREAKTVST